MAVSLSSIARRGLAALLKPAVRPLAGGLVKSSACSALVAGQWARSVGFVQGDKLRGNIREAWEKREMQKVIEKRNPEFFEDFKVGDSIAVRSINPYSPDRMITFCGVCIAKRGSLMGTGFTLQNNIEGVGVTQKFLLYSPQLKGIQVVKRPAKYPRRAKMYNLHERPPKEWTVSVHESELMRLPKELY